MKDRFNFRFWNNLSKQYENTYSLKSCDFLDYVIPEQCTGLNDINGKLIYEGDIIKSKQYDEIKVVYWNEHYSAFRVKYENTLDCGIIWQNYIDEYEIEVIGNIHENKELLDER